MYICRQRQEIFLYSKAFRPALGSTQVSTQWVPRVTSPGVKRSGCYAGHSPTLNAEIKNSGTILLLPYTSSKRGAELIKQRDNFILTFVIRRYIAQILTEL